MRYLIIFLFSAITYGQNIANNPYVTFPAASCTDTAGDVFPTGNAASECSDEADSIDIWGTVGSGAVASVAETSGGSDYVIEITSTDATASQGGTIVVPTNSSINYDVTIRYRVTVDVGSTQAIRAWTGVTNSPDENINDDGNWHTVVYSGIDPTGSAISIRIYSTRVAAAGANKVQIDYITVVPE